MLSLEELSARPFIGTGDRLSWEALGAQRGCPPPAPALPLISTARASEDGLCTRESRNSTEAFTPYGLLDMPGLVRRAFPTLVARRPAEARATV